MSDSIEIEVSGPVRGSIRPPGSKSITNRALVCAALAEGRSTLRGVLDSEDTRVMIDSLGRLGLAVEHNKASSTVQIEGCGGRPSVPEADLYIANSGTTVRFLTALATLGKGRIRLDGTPRMRERPIGDLLGALGQLGAEVECELGTGCPPVVVHGKGLAGGTARVAGDISSQYLSGLLMAAPCAESPVELVVDGELVSKPYVEMTLAVMGSFGVAVEAGNLQRFAVPNRGAYAATDYSVEPDASAASYFFAAAAITGGEVTVEGLSRIEPAGRRGILRVPGIDGLRGSLGGGSDHGGGRSVARDRGRHERHQRHGTNAGSGRRVCPRANACDGSGTHSAQGD